MKELAAIMFLVFGLSLTANADIWKWVDEHGNVHYGDRPAREYAANAVLVSYKPRNRPASTSGDGQSVSGQGDDAQAYYCEQARNIYRSYVDAPRLYRTGEDGQREYLSDEEAASALATAQASVEEWCN
jgi:hypothetical protein